MMPNEPAASRRAVLSAAAGGVAALAIQSITHPLAARGANDDPLMLGQTNEASSRTTLSSGDGEDPTLVIYNTAPKPSMGAGPVSISGSSDYGIGVHAGTGTGYGVYAEAMGNGVPVYAVGGSPDRVGLQIKQGRFLYQHSSRVLMKKGTSKYTRTLPGVTSSSQVFAVLRSYRSGTYVAAVICRSGSFTIRLNRALARNTYCSYFVVN
jgi:hypothetical protein